MLCRSIEVTNNHGAVANNTGGSQAHNNLQPYITVYICGKGLANA